MNKPEVGPLLTTLMSSEASLPFLGSKPTLPPALKPQLLPFAFIPKAVDL